MSALKEFLKVYLKPHLIRSGLVLSRNMRYDRQTWLIMKRILRADSHCIDVGCHKGELMDWMLELAPKGKHSGFEPIPYLFEKLKLKYGSKVQLFSNALGCEPGKATFSIVKNAPAYSGLRQRLYQVENPEIEEVEVTVETLDLLFSNQQDLRLLKVDVEGGEYDVLRGGKALIQRCRPYILFEFGLGSAEYYGSGPEIMFALMESMQMQIFTLKAFLQHKAALSNQEFVNHFSQGTEYYFLAAPAEKPFR